MEELGIGRPSTYASTMSVLRDREYVRMDKKRLVPEGKGRLVTAFLESFFQRYVEYDFTADLEEKLDRISAGELNWKDVLRTFWTEFTEHVDETKELRVSTVLDALNEILGEFVFPHTEAEVEPRKCPSCEDGRLSLKLSRYGAFIGCENYPECRYTRQLSDPNGEDAGGVVSPDGVPLGTDPETGETVSLRTGRFGPYVQLGDGGKPKRTGIPKSWSTDDIDLEKALMLLSLPREVGIHPETGSPITAGLGRYGPFVEHERKYANLETVEEVFTIGANRAITVLAEKQARGRNGRSRPAALKELGDHPELGGPITVRDGRYGPYVNHGRVNATLPKSVKPEEVTLDQAVDLIAQKAAKGGGKGRAKRSTKSG